MFLVAVSMSVSLYAMNHDLDEQFRCAITHDKVAKVKKLLRAGARAYIIDEYGDTILHQAATCGSSKCMREFVWSGINVDVVNAFSNTALYLAATSGHTECLEILLAAGATVNYQNPHSGRTALIAAADKGNEGCLEMLLRAEADVSLCDYRGMNALACAIEEGHRDCVAILAGYYKRKGIFIPSEQEAQICKLLFV